MNQQARKAELRASLEAAREKTLWLLEQVPDDFLRRRVHSFYSPIGWHFGHVGRTEEYWVISQALHQPVLDEHLSFLYADLPDNPKDNRTQVPDRAGALAYMAATRERVLSALDLCDLDTDDPFLADGYAWEFALQHECQHQETIIEMLQLIQKQVPVRSVEPLEWVSTHAPEFVDIPSGSFRMGSDDRHGYDNEKTAHLVHVDDFSLAKYPVTAFEWTQFMGDGGYEYPSLWSEEGWAWKCSENATMPEYWIQQPNGWAMHAPLGPRAIHPAEPVSSLSWFEADAFATWAGKRLPSEVEWEYAAASSGGRFPWGDGLASAGHASHGLHTWGPSPVGTHPKGVNSRGLNDLAGGVWEWTASSFLPYPGFTAFPYDGYSKDHMLGEHRVCRGGSWATAAPILRCSFRNWYVPTYRQGLLGMRLAD